MKKLTALEDLTVLTNSLKSKNSLENIRKKEVTIERLMVLMEEFQSQIAQLLLICAKFVEENGELKRTVNELSEGKPTEN